MNVKQFNDVCLNKMRTQYIRLMKDFDFDLDDTSFCWHKGSPLHIYIIFVPTLFGCGCIFFACLSKLNNKITIKYHDLDGKDGSDKLISDGSSKEILSRLESKHIINNVKPLDKTFFHIGIVIYSEAINDMQRLRLTPDVTKLLNFLVKIMFSLEINNMQNKFKQPSLMSTKLIVQNFFERNFKFKHVIRDVNDAQFTRDLSECISAYNNGQWYICAAGIGGLIEDLMYKTIKGYYGYYKSHKSQLSKDVKRTFNRLCNGGEATAKDYELLFRHEPINAPLRSIRLIKAFFLMRNSVDHYNSGMTNKTVCDLLFSGVMDVYNDYYLKTL